MANLTGTNLAAKIVPFTTSDQYPTHEDTYGAGGYRTVSTITERNAIPTARRKEGMLVYVIEDSTVYQLVSGGTWTTFEGMGGGGGSSGLNFQGMWNAYLNTPVLASSIGTHGYQYVVDVAGSTTLDGISDWQIGDWVIFDQTVWKRVRPVVQPQTISTADVKKTAMLSSLIYG